MCHFLGIVFLGRVEGQNITFIRKLFFKIPHVEFSSRSSPSPSHIFYRMIYKDNDGWKHKKNHFNYSNQNLTKRATFSLCNTCPANYYLKFCFTIFAWLAILTCVHQGTIRMHFFIFSTQRALHNSLKKFQNPKKDHTLVPYPGHKLSDPGHSSNTFRLDSPWSHSSSLLNRFLPGVTGEFHN